MTRLAIANRPLPTNRKVGLGVLTPPPGLLDTSDGRGRVRTPNPTCLWRFRGSRREKCFRRFLILTLSPIRWGRGKNRVDVWRGYRSPPFQTLSDHHLQTLLPADSFSCELDEGLAHAGTAFITWTSEQF